METTRKNAGTKAAPMRLLQPFAITPRPILMVQQNNDVINRRCNEMRRLLAEIEEEVESLRLDPGNAKGMEAKIMLLRRELARVRDEQSELR